MYTNTRSFQKSNSKSMKKFICNFCIYIGLLIPFFNSVPVYAAPIPLPFEEQIPTTINPKDNTPLFKTSNEFLKLWVTILLIDKLYPQSDIDKDITPVLHLVWPQTKQEKLEKIAPFIQGFIMIKRRYTYTVNRLKQKIKAAALLIEDSPIIASDGEYAFEEATLKNQTSDKEYKVTYQPYKYLEYDYGQEGEPVRLRDRNYEPVKQSVLDEILLALLKFDIGRFYQALRKLPAYNDGTREKPVLLEDGVRTRLLADTAELGKQETIKAVLEIHVPKGYYVNGDYLNKQTRPKFYLSEDTKEDLNIKEYELFYPRAIGVTNNNTTSRILVGLIRYPLTFTRKDINKSMILKGNFTFEVCRAKTKDCRTMVSSNRLALKASPDYSTSIHSTFVLTGFANVPQEQTKHASFKTATYDKRNNRLNITFKTTKTFSNVAAMVEDAAGTDFINPHYNIKDDEVTVSFEHKVTSKKDTLNNLNNNELAVTAAFDETEVLRTSFIPQTTPLNQDIPFIPQPNYLQAFLFGLLLNLIPGILYLFERLLRLYQAKPERLAITGRYILGSFFGLMLFYLYNHLTPWYNLYSNKWIMSAALLLSTSYLISIAGYMDFNLFRPLRGKIRRGFLIGLFSILFMAAYPVPYKADILDTCAQLTHLETLTIYFLIWLGIITLPLTGLLLHHKINSLIKKIAVFNTFYIFLYLIPLIWIIYATKGLFALIILLLCATLIGITWYIYPLAVTAAASHKRTQKKQEQVFKTVQKHFAFLVFILWFITSIIYGLLAPKVENIPSIKDFEITVKESISKEEPLLFVLTTDWSISSLLNRSILNKLHDSNIKIFVYKTQTNSDKIKEWLNAYDKVSPPLNILFTKRHPKGLVLPDNLQKTDWQKAVADFAILQNNERKTTNE